SRDWSSDVCSSDLFYRKCFNPLCRKATERVPGFLTVNRFFNIQKFIKMAKSKDNVVMQGASGKIGRNLVFRQKGDQTIIARRPRETAAGRPISKDQLNVQQRFLDAALYAKKAIKDEDMKAAYKAKATINQTAYNVAFKDFFTPPTVRRLNDTGYSGQAGDEITFMVRDIMRVTQIEVEILDSSEVLIETG